MIIDDGNRSSSQRKKALRRGEAFITFENFGFRYEVQKEATLQDISLKIYPGEKVLIAGPSGSGKSTLGNCINALAGNIYKGEMVGNLTVAGLQPAKNSVSELSKLVGTVLQDSDNQFIGLTVGEDVSFALENDAVPQDEMKQIVEKTTAMVGMEDFLSRSPFELSGGQKQRVSMAGILVDDVECLLFDEPLANLDPRSGRTAIELIDDINASTNKTIIIIEHRLEDVLHRSVDRILLMRDGRLIMDTSPDALLSGTALSDNGIREPLYLTALKFAGCTIAEEDMPSSLQTLNIEPFKKNIHAWYGNCKAETPPEASNLLLDVEGVSFSYDGEQNALKNIGFSVRKGEILSILGKNGSGKSTLSRIIMGVLSPDSGSIRFRGEDLLKQSPAERSKHVGFVMQNPNQMISHHLVLEEVAFGLTLRGLPKEEIRTKTEWALKLCDLYGVRNWAIQALSYGQKKRVSIASILVMEPSLIILDEPTAGQDHRRYTNIMQFLKSLNESLNITVILVTHDMHLALEYSQRAIVLSDGELICDSSIADVFSNVDVIDRAYLKTTSLYELALKTDIKSPESFINCFIQNERGQ